MQPQTLTDVEIVFPATVSHLLPAYSEIPKEFKGYGGNQWVELAENWFFKGIDPDIFIAKPGIDRNTALGHLLAVMESFELKHQHKIAGTAYLMSQWFEPIKAKG